MKNMKSKLFGLALLASMLQLSQGFCAEAPKNDGKVYVKRRAVRFIDKDIVVFTKDGAFKTKTLFSDENGVFVKATELTKTDVQKGKFGGCNKGKQGWKHKGSQKNGWKKNDGHKNEGNKNEGKKNGWKQRHKNAKNPDAPAAAQ